MDPVEVTTVEAPSVAGVKPTARDEARGPRRRHHGPVHRARWTRRAPRRRLHVTADGKAVKGTVRWSADGTRLDVHAEEARCRTARRSIVQRRPVAPRSAAGAPTSSTPTKVAFRTVPRPAHRRRRRSRPGGGGAANGSWAAVETLLPAAHELHPHRRLGDVVGRLLVARRPERRAAVASAGDLGPGLAALRAAARDPQRVHHFIGGNPGDRLRAAGLRRLQLGREHRLPVGGNPFSAVLGTHLFYQSERPYNGGHYRNLMNPGFDRSASASGCPAAASGWSIDFYRG